MIIIFLSLTIFVFLWLLRAKRIKLIYFHVPTVSVFWGCMLFVLLGVPIDYFFYDSRFDHSYWLVYSHTAIFILGLTLGLVVTWEVAPASAYQLSFLSKINRDYYIFWVLYFLGVVLIIALYARMPVIPLFAEDVHVERVRALSGLGYNYKLAIFCFYLGSFGLSLYYFSRGKWFFPLVLSCVAFLAILPTANRIDSLFILFMLGMAALYTRIVITYGIVTFSLYLKCAVLGASVLVISAVLQYIRHYGIEGFVSAEINDVYNFSKGGVYHRFWVQLENLSYLVDRNVRVEPFLTFYNDIMMVVPRSGINQTSGVVLKEEAGLHFRGGGITPTFIGEGIVQFGYLGGALYSFFLAFFISCLSPFFTRYLGRKYLFFPFLFVGSFFLHGVATSTLFAVLTHSVAPAVFLLILVVFLLKFFKHLNPTAASGQHQAKSSHAR